MFKRFVILWYAFLIQGLVLMIAIDTHNPELIHNNYTPVSCGDTWCPAATGPWPAPNTETTANYHIEDEITVKDNVRASLVDYVFKYSQRISRGQAHQIVDAAMKTQHPALILALIRHESAFNPTAVSSANAIGLGQIVPRYHAKRLISKGIIAEVRDLYEIDKNMQATDFILTEMRNKAKGNLTKTLISYYGAANPKYRAKIGESFFELQWLIKEAA